MIPYLPGEGKAPHVAAKIPAKLSAQVLVVLGIYTINITFFFVIHCAILYHVFILGT